MEFTTTSSAIIVRNLLIAMLTNFQVSDEQVERELAEYFQDHPGGGGTSYFLYDRNSIAASNWIIDHNLNKYPQVTLIDDEGNEFEADIFYNSLNQVTVVFAEPTSGKAALT